MKVLPRAALALTTMLAFASAPAAAQVVALGASNTAGQGVGSAQAFPAQLQALLKSKGVSMSVGNAGISGDTTGGMLGRLGTAVPAGTKIVIVQYGGNDARQGQGAQRQSNINKIESTLSARGIRVVAADNLVASALRSGLKQADGIHLTVAGHRQVAAGLADMIR